MCWSANMPGHRPLYRQARIYSQGVNLDRDTLADWVGRAAFALRPVHDAGMVDLKRSTKLRGQTQRPCSPSGRQKDRAMMRRWFEHHGEGPDSSGRWPAMTRPRGGTPPAGVAFTYAPDRGWQHAERVLQGFGMPHRPTVMPDRAA